MHKLLYILYILLFIACKPDKNITKKDNLIEIDTDTTQVQAIELPIHGELTPEKLAKYYPKLTDTLKDVGIFYAEEMELNTKNQIITSLLHNTGASDEMILSTHNESLELIDHLYIGKTTNFDNGKSQTVNCRIQDNDEILFNKVDWGYVEEEIDTVQYQQLIVKINDDGSISSTIKKQRNVSNKDSIQKPESSTQILLPTTYRLNSEEKTLANNLNSNWFDLTKQGDAYYLSKPNYTIKESEDECSGALTKTIISNNKTLLFINNKQLQLGKINTINFEKNKIWPNEKVTFNYNNTAYTVRAEGTIISTDNVQTETGEERFSEVENYKLYISTNNTTETLFLEEKSFNDTFVTLLFVGDIDADGKLDLLFEANRHYEEKRLILYLSSEAEKKEIIKKSAEIAISFSC